MDTKLYDLKSAYGYTLNMTKEQRLRMGETSMTHAMVITAVQVDKDGKPVKYKVENSWSDSAGEKGWFMMTADWFKEHVFQVVVPRSIMEDKWVKVLDQEPVVLPPWDPMVSEAFRLSTSATNRSLTTYSTRSGLSCLSCFEFCMSDSSELDCSRAFLFLLSRVLLFPFPLYGIGVSVCGLSRFVSTLCRVSMSYTDT
jgi:hypothetical protein